MRLLLLPLLCSLALTGQSTLGLTAFYPFESNPGDATGDATNLGVPVGAVDYDCGVSGEALLLGGSEDYVRIPGGSSNNVNREFDEEDFTVSLYFKSAGGSGNQYLLAKRDTNCALNQYFYLRYAPASRTLEASLRQENVEATIVHPITNTACWQQVTLVREDTRVRLFLNGQAVGETTTASRVNIDNTGELLIGNTECTEVDESPFQGLIDEVRVYGRALSTDEVGELYGFPDRILTPPTQLFLGQSVTVDLNRNCDADFRWTPTSGVDPLNVAEPVITPTAAGRRTFVVSIGDEQTDCIARDSLTLTVINPNTLDCSELFVPAAFTPNGIGPEQNETFGIANPFAIPDLVSFEIYDRQGALMFRAADAFARWDGTYKGEPVNPGVMLWRTVYRCEGEEVVSTGSVTILR